MGGAEDAKTMAFEDVRWLEPVQTIAELRATVADGALCYVEDENAIYQRANGEWVKRSTGFNPGKK